MHTVLEGVTSVVMLTDVKRGIWLERTRLTKGEKRYREDVM